LGKFLGKGRRICPGGKEGVLPPTRWGDKGEKGSNIEEGILEGDPW